MRRTEIHIVGQLHKQVALRCIEQQERTILCPTPIKAAICSSIEKANEPCKYYVKRHDPTVYIKRVTKTT